MEKNIVIVGNGAAGHYAAETIRNKDKECTVTMISSESHMSYYRPRLSHYLGEEELGKNFFLKEESWYEENCIEVMLQNTVENIDVDKKTVRTSGGKVIPYDALILASGGNCFLPDMEGSDKKGVFTLKTLDDAVEIKKWMGKSQKAVIIGGGLLGLEAAGAMRNVGLDVTINNVTDRLMSNQICSETGAFLGNIVKDKGIDVILQDTAVKINGGERVESVVFESGKEIEADIVLFSVGIRADLKIAKDVGIDCKRGILVDRWMRTNVEDVFACGDAVEMEGRGFGNWIYAMQMGKIAGANALGGNAEFKESIPMIMLNSFGTSINCIGETIPKEGYESIVESDCEKKKFKKLFFRDGKIVGGVVIGDVQSYPKIMTAINEKKDISQFKKEGQPV
ncbi:Pyridine nucleotide-disulphide oxidoreductase [Peptoclostridium litorale DSM 5388]|uniref:Nitrite reductase [NAD(P)H] n=1 Tax=Peptoclostridium litorale DSM 5388 TaxID=1121324 RepID=A0A069RFC8_PEPLI|nr:FAD-dependent oxidoreductase [Peptoclostridium litorale]KDR94905.1 nitrite reductase [NAD(P)H] [Peptoclostridium litorale DSM 5388]SIN95317.1 Pyridine nucleotide-disulphide oxidoreductase [Peptoclostridium litorale DSM 5388]